MQQQEQQYQRAITTVSMPHAVSEVTLVVVSTCVPKYPSSVHLPLHHWRSWRNNCCCCCFFFFFFFNFCRHHRPTAAAATTTSVAETFAFLARGLLLGG
jgi:hypothetical protein